MATFSLFGSLQLTPKWQDGTVVDSTNASWQFSLANGTGASQADAYWSTTLAIAPGGASSVDLRSLPLSAFGSSGTLAIASVRMIAIRNLSSGSAVTVSGSSTNKWTGFAGGAMSIGPAATVFVDSSVSGMPTSTTSRIIEFANADAIVATTGSTTVGSTIISALASTASLQVGASVSGVGIPVGATIESIDSGTSITLSNAATATGTSVSLTIENPDAELEVYVVGVKA